MNALREDHALAVSLVAEAEGEAVGHIAFSVAKTGGAECGWFLLGPIGVLPAHQRRGIGQALGAQGCVLVGDPAYYVRFGFTANPALTMEGVPPEVVLSLPFAGPVPRGPVSHHAAFSVTA